MSVVLVIPVGFTTKPKYLWLDIVPNRCEKERCRKGRNRGRDGEMRTPASINVFEK